jgi:hypothetical protein
MKERKTGHYLVKKCSECALDVFFFSGNDFYDETENFYWMSDTPLDLQLLFNQQHIVPDYIERGLSDID